ncbi:MAG: DNA-processing protein DprA [Gemmatimonadales bacterium]
MKLSPDDIAYLTLALVPGIGRSRLDMLLAAFGSCENALGASHRALTRVVDISPAAATAICDATPNMGEKVVKRAIEMGAHVLLPKHEQFPSSLRQIPKAPTLLFAKGRLELLDSECTAIVGSRAHTRYGAGACRMFASGLSRAGLTVVSGMARGLDAIAHTATLDVGGGTIGVLGNGLGVVYPAANRALYERVAADGCLLTEHPPGERPNAGSFPKRNRLISGLSRVTLLIEARERSGALITAGCALAQGHEVLAVPGPITSPVSVGCNRLIQQGAKPALGLRDVLEEYGMSMGDAPAVAIANDLTAEEREMLDILDQGLEQVDEVAHRAGMSVPEVLAVLTSLEIRGLVTQDPGKLFRPVQPLTVAET